jgi:hypothetical protein
VVDAFSNPLGWKADPDPESNKDKFTDRARELFDLNMAIVRTFKGKDGKRILEWLRSVTIEAGTWKASLPYNEAIAHGFAREGQNALVRDIEHRIKIMESCKTPEDLCNLM